MKKPKKTASPPPPDILLEEIEKGIAEIVAELARKRPRRELPNPWMDE